MTCCNNKTQLCLRDSRVMLGISSSDKDGDNSEAMGRKDTADYQRR